MCLYAVQDYFQFVQNYFQYIFYSWPDGFVDNKIFSTLWAEAVFNIFPVIYSFENFQQQIFHTIGEVVYALFCMLFCYHSSTVKKRKPHRHVISTIHLVTFLTPPPNEPIEMLLMLC